MSPLKKHSFSRLSKVALLVVPLALIGVARADDADPAGRVARLAFVQGQVSIAPAGLDEWAAADLNRPLTNGDKLWSDEDSRAELSIGSAVVRLGSATGFSFLNLDDRSAQMQVTAGTVGIHVRSMSDTLEVDTPNVAIAILSPGDYRIEVNDAGDTTAVNVTGGTAEVSGGGQDFAVHPQQRVTFTGTQSLSRDVASLGAPDAFDRWGYDRDRRTQAVQASSYVSPEVIGAEDLDENGTWQSTPDDGYVWAPNTVAVGWVPYRFGHWLWVSPWGWTWVDDAPWGFAPFHYGRWATFGGRWCWVPGPRRVHPVYAPALVAWVGGAQFGASVGFAGAGGVAWFPLGPREVYVPAYPVSQTYVRNINISNTTVSNTYITEVYNHKVSNIHYVNRNAPGAMTAVSQTAFTTAQAVGRNAVRLGAHEIGAATVSATAPAITPAKHSLLGAGAAGPGIRRPPPVIQNRVVLAKTPPPRAPVPFALQEAAIRANGGRPLARSETASMQILAPAVHVRMTKPAAGIEPQTGMARAARPTPAAPPSPAPPMNSRPATDRPPAAAPALTRPPVERPAPPPQELQQDASAIHSERPAAAAPAAAPQPIERPSAPPQEVQQRASGTRSDRPPAAISEPASDDRARANGARPPEVRSSSPAPDLGHRLDRPATTAKPVPAPPPVYSPPPAPLAPPVNLEKAPPPTSKIVKPAPQAAKPAGPLERNRENN